MAASKGLNERALIADIFAPLAAQTPGAFNLEDDAARITPPAGKDLVITTDTIVAGVHFMPDDPADSIAAKALRVNLSDLAAKGAEPLGYTLNIALSERTNTEWVREFAGGLHRDQLHYGILLYGGDTVKTPGPLSISITAFGTVETGCMVKREGAQVGDHIFVSGTIGDGALGLMVARGDEFNGHSEEHSNYLLQRYRLPQPRCALVPAIARYATASMDVSDGLIGDIGALTAVSKVSADITINDIPLSPAAQSVVKGNEEFLHHALAGGDDYEIICTIPPKHSKAFAAMAEQCDVAVCRIGVIITGNQSPRFLDDNEKQVTFRKERYEH